MSNLIPREIIERKIYLIRGHKVMIDSDLAELYGATTRNLKRQVRRNIERFPEEFMFKLTKKEWNELVPNWHQYDRMKHSYVLPFVFTEHGVAMLSSVLNSEKAIKVSIVIIKTFVKLRELMFTHKELAHKLTDLERKIEKHDEEISSIFEAIRQLMAPPPAKARVITGFKPSEK